MGPGSSLVREDEYTVSFILLEVFVSPISVNDGTTVARSRSLGEARRLRRVFVPTAPGASRGSGGETCPPSTPGQVRAGPLRVEGSDLALSPGPRRPRPTPHDTLAPPPHAIPPFAPPTSPPPSPSPPPRHPRPTPRPPPLRPPPPFTPPSPHPSPSSRAYPRGHPKNKTHLPPYHLF